METSYEKKKRPPANDVASGVATPSKIPNRRGRGSGDPFRDKRTRPLPVALPRRRPPALGDSAVRSRRSESSPPPLLPSNSCASPSPEQSLRFSAGARFVCPGWLPPVPPVRCGAAGFYFPLHLVPCQCPANSGTCNAKSISSGLLKLALVVHGLHACH
jgi:hypothetical protein